MLVLVSILNTAFGVMSWTMTIQSGGSVATFGLGLGFILAFATLSALAVSLLPCLATLADRIPDRRLARRFRVLTLALVAILILGAADLAAILSFDLSVDVDSAGYWVSVVVALICVVGGGATTVLIWVLIRLYRKAIKQSLAGSVSYEALFGDVPTEVALPTGENDWAAARSPRTETGDTGGESTDVDEVPSSGDIPCVHCGYNLRGLPEGGRCPECGTPIAQSSHGNLLSAADPAWVQRIYRGQALVCAGCVVLVTYWFLFSVTGSRGSLIVVHALGASSAVEAGSEAVLSAAAVLLLLLGAFTATALDPRLSLTEQPIALRRFVRWSIVALVALTGHSYLVPVVVKQLGVNAEVAALSSTVLLCASGLVFLSALVGICYYLAGLAMRIPDAKLATRTRSKVVRFVVCVGTLLLIVVWAVLTHGSGASAGASVTLAGQRIVVSPMVIVLILVLTLVALGYIVSLMILMSTYRKAFRKCLLEARKHAAAT